MKNIPDDMNTIAKMVNDTIKTREPPGSATIKIYINDGRTMIQLPLLCGACGRLVSNANIRCDCPCHPDLQGQASEA